MSFDLVCFFTMFTHEKHGYQWQKTNQVIWIYWTSFYMYYRIKVLFNNVMENTTPIISVTTVFSTIPYK